MTTPQLPLEPADHHWQAFEVFHTANPEVMAQLELLVQQWLRRGRGRLGIEMLWNVLRWERYMSTDDPASEWKLNNNYKAYYVRLLQQAHPEWADLFELRTSQADDRLWELAVLAARWVREGR